jgi:hypothetical protein
MSARIRYIEVLSRSENYRKIIHLFILSKNKNSQNLSWSEGLNTCPLDFEDSYIRMDSRKDTGFDY